MHADRRRRLGAIGIVAIAAALAASCSGANNESKSSTAGSPRAAPPAVSRAAAAPGASAQPEIDLTVAKRPGGDRQVISTAQLDLEARDIDQTVQHATALVVNASGYVFSESSSLTDRQHAHVVFKVPPDRFDRVVLALGRVATLAQRRIGTVDVTGQVVDLGARLAAAQTSAERLRQLLANSASVPDLLNVEGQLTAREGQADSLSGELAALRAQVDMATVTIDVSPLPAHHAAEPGHARPGFRRGLRAGATGFANTARVVEAGVGLALPFAPLAILALAGWWIARRRARPAPSPS